METFETDIPPRKTFDQLTDADHAANDEVWKKANPTIGKPLAAHSAVQETLLMAAEGREVESPTGEDAAAASVGGAVRDRGQQKADLRKPPRGMLDLARSELAHVAIVAIGRDAGPVRFSQSGNPADTLRKVRAEDWEERRLHATRWVPKSSVAYVMERLRLEQTVMGRHVGGTFFAVAGEEAALAITLAAEAVGVAALDDAAFLEKCMGRIDGWGW